MKKAITIALLISAAAYATDQPQQQTEQQKPQVVYVPVAVPQQNQQPQGNQKLTESQKDEVLFCNLLDILGNFGTVLLNKDNTEVALGGVSNMISGIVSAFHTIITKRNPTEVKQMMIRALRSYSDQLEKTL